MVNKRERPVSPPGNRYQRGRNKKFLVRTIRQAVKYYEAEKERPHVHPRRVRSK